MFKYRPEIDGLRAIAIIPVIFFHAGFDSFKGGYVGVDIFFVISGYLISSIIFKELSTETFTLKSFYERRARRILPALFLVVIVSMPLALLWMPPADMLDFSQSIVSIPLFFSNFLFYFESGYFDATMEVKPLFHTWSLAVEEQFYMVFPLLLIFLWKYGKRKIITTVLIIFAISLIITEIFVHFDKMLAFFMLPFRVWELFIGVGAALIGFYRLVPTRKILFKNLWSLIGLFLILLSIFSFNEETLVPGFYALIPTLGTAIIIVFSDNSHVGRIIGNRFFVGIGLVSYSAYLWHQPLFAFLRVYRFGDTKIGMMISAILITFILAFLTWKFVEKPFRNKYLISSKVAIRSFLIAGFTIVGFGLLGIFSNGFEDLYKSRLTEVERVFLENSKEVSRLRNNKIDTKYFSECYIEYENTDKFYTNFNNCSKEYGSAVLLMGDSHMNNVKRSFSKMKKFRFVVSIAGYHCHPYHYYDEKNISSCDFDEISKFIKLYTSKINFLVYNQLGSYFLEDENGDTLNHKSVSYATNENMDVNLSHIDNILKFLDLYADKVPVIWLSSWVEPRYPMHSPRKMTQYDISNLDYIPNVVSMFSNVDSTVDRAIEKTKSKVLYVKLLNSELKKSFLPIIQNNCVVFNDKDHLSECGEELAAPIFYKKISNVLNTKKKQK
jgi:peptidoglycan/LPS O-acetylase OafA/YrhL